MFKQNFLTEVKNMKAFTMIELIFVIVILGILAAVAIPRLAATRDDAEVVRVATNIKTLIQDVGGYYTSQAAFSSDVSKMTNVQNPIRVRNETCAELIYKDINETVLTIYKGGQICSKVWQSSSLKNIEQYEMSGGIIFVETK